MYAPGRVQRQALWHCSKMKWQRLTMTASEFAASTANSTAVPACRCNEDLQHPVFNWTRAFGLLAGLPLPNGSFVRYYQSIQHNLLCTLTSWSIVPHCNHTLRKTTKKVYGSWQCPIMTMSI